MRRKRQPARPRPRARGGSRAHQGLLAQDPRTAGAVANRQERHRRSARAVRAPGAPDQSAGRGIGEALRAAPMRSLEPGIIALWHGQHLLTPAYYPKGRPLVAMVSRSADAELNALMLEKFGIEAVRGSGGRDSTRHLDKGGAKALIALKKSLDGRQERRHDRRHTPWHAARRGAGHRPSGAALGPPDHARGHRHQPPQGAGEELGQDHHQPAFRPLPRSSSARRSACRRMPTTPRWSASARNSPPRSTPPPPRPTASWTALNERALGARHAVGLPLRGRRRLSADRALRRLAHLPGQGRPQRAAASATASPGGRARKGR